MSNFNARRAPNVSQYLANLNTIPSQHELSAQQQDFDLGNDGLEFLTNTEFFDFDASTFGAGAQSVDFNPPAPQAQQGKNHALPMNVPGYQFSEFQTYPSSLAASPSALAPSPPSALHGAYPPQQHHFAAHPSLGDERKASIANMQPVIDLEEQSRSMAEDDKRRRNTAASARFRVKKKQREQALEKQSKEMLDKVSSLEGRIQQLEMENKWLKGLITEKSGAKGVEEQFKLFKADQAELKETERSTSTRTDGVGTEDDAEEEFEA